MSSPNRFAHLSPLVLGVDPGSRYTGWGIVGLDGNALIHVAHGTITTTHSAPFVERLREVYLGVGEVIKSCQPSHLSIERCFVGKNVQSALKLGHIRGAVIALALDSGLAVHEYTPSEIKQSAAGSGQAKKEQVAQMVTALLGLNATPQADAADALGAAVCHLLRPTPITLPDGQVLPVSSTRRRRTRRR